MTASTSVIEFSDVFSFAAPPEVVWSALERMDLFERWWGWLSDFRLEGGALRTGAVLHGVVTPPLPYRMRLQVELEECERPAFIEAAVHGDLEGRGRLALAAVGDGTRAEIGWTIEMMQRPMRMAARIAYPMLRWGHDRVVDATVAGFRRQLDRGG